MNNLRDRIAEVLYEELPYSILACVEAADAVIAALGLESETSYGTTYPNAPIEDRKLTRYVTNWKADDE
jgi:hypothetical protein